MKQREWKIHGLCLAMVLVAEAIGVKKYQLGPGTVLLLPMLYALVMGMFFPALRIVNRKDMEMASPFIGISVMLLTAKMGTSIGPNLTAVLSAGPALILQEIGNIFTIILALPVAVLVFKMGREAVGAAFSISREGSLAIVGNVYGLDSAEGRGVMGAYITGTLFGAVFNGLMVGFLVSLNIFHPYALGMACGTGSASMMASALGPVVAAYPALEAELSAFAASSQILTTVDGLYISLFVAIPLTEWLYRKMKGPAATDSVTEVKI